MERSFTISNITLSMREFQKENNIKGQCVTNTQYLYDTIKMNLRNNVKTKAVIVFSHDEEKNNVYCVEGHLVLVLSDDETIIEPSYEIFCLKNKLYFDNIKDFLNIFDDKVKIKIDKKKLVSHHIKFMKLSEQINNGECLVADKKFYNEQADYIEKIYSKYIKLNKKSNLKTL